jgi:hypothetical protein
VALGASGASAAGSGLVAGDSRTTGAGADFLRKKLNIVQLRISVDASARSDATQEAPHII